KRQPRERPRRGPRPASLAGDSREDAEGRLADGELGKLGIHAAELVGSALVAALDLDRAHRERPADRLHGAEAALARLGGAEQVEVDLDAVDLLHATDERVPVILVGVEEGARALDARPRVDDLVAVDLAPAALDLVLGPERKLRGHLDAPRLHVGIVRCPAQARKT